MTGYPILFLQRSTLEHRGPHARCTANARNGIRPLMFSAQTRWGYTAPLHCKRAALFETVQGVYRLQDLVRMNFYESRVMRPPYFAHKLLISTAVSSIKSEKINA